MISCFVLFLLVVVYNLSVSFCIISPEWKDGEMHGNGILIYKDGTRLEGEFCNGKLNGSGTKTFRKERGLFSSCLSDKYVGGKFLVSKQCGSMFLYCFLYNLSVSFCIISLEWKDSKMHGNGTNYSKSGARQEGEFCNDKTHGSGTTFFANGDKHASGGKFMIFDYFFILYSFSYNLSPLFLLLSPEWKDGKMHGNFIIVYKTGTRYEGEFCNDKLSGSGTMFYASEVQDARLASGKFLISDSLM